MSEVNPKRPPRHAVPSDDSAHAAAPVIAPSMTLPASVAEPVREGAPLAPPLPGDSAPDPTADSWTALADAQAALARGFEAFAVEATALTRAGTDAAADAALALLGAKTLAESVEINATLARREVDALIAGGAKLSEIGVAVWSEASRPLLSRLGAVWIAG